MRALEQRTALFTAACALIAILVGVQLWLISATVDAMLEGEKGVLVPAAAASGILALASGGILLYVLSFDRDAPDRKGRG